MTAIALVTAAAARLLDEDLAPLEAALRLVGITPSIVEWDIADAARALGHSRAHDSLASNSRVKALRARQELGWAPTHGAMLDWIRDEMPVAA